MLNVDKHLNALEPELRIGARRIADELRENSRGILVARRPDGLTDEQWLEVYLPALLARFLQRIGNDVLNDAAAEERSYLLATERHNGTHPHEAPDR